MHKINKPRLGMILLLISLICTIVGFILFVSTYNVFKYELNRWCITCLVFSIWFLLFMIINKLIKGENLYLQNMMYPVVVFLIVFATIEFINPCLSPIGIYFTVHNMGDTATNDIGVPRAIITTCFLLVGALTCLISSFMNSIKENKNEISK